MKLHTSVSRETQRDRGRFDCPRQMVFLMASDPDAFRTEFELTAPRQTLKATDPARVAATTFSVQPPQGWRHRLDGTGVLMVKPSKGPLVLIRISRLSGSDPYETMVTASLKIRGPVKNTRDAAPLKLQDQEIPAKSFETVAEGRLLRVLWGIAGNPGNYQDVFFGAEPALFEMNEPTARSCLATLRLAK